MCTDHNRKRLAVRRSLGLKTAKLLMYAYRNLEVSMKGIIPILQF